MEVLRENNVKNFLNPYSKKINLLIVDDYYVQ